MKKSLVVLALAAAFAPMMAQAEAGDWVVRARAANINPDEDSKLGKTMNNVPSLAGTIPQGAELKVDSNTILEFDISYYFTKNIAAELILATGSKHEVSITGSNPGAAVPNQLLGSVDVLPPTLTVQWHFNPDQMIDPYVGAGINYTAFLDRNLNIRAGAAAPAKIKVDSDSWGYALQAGVDVNLKDGWLINADVKYINIETDVKLKNPLNSGVWTKIDSLDINPWVFGIGIGKKF